MLLLENFQKASRAARNALADHRCVSNPWYSVK